MLALLHDLNDLGVCATVCVNVDVSLEVDLTVVFKINVQHEDSKMSNSNINIMKNVKSGIVALLGRLVADSTSSESQTEITP